ncbi:MAG: glycosyltransferase family 4 protein [Pseudomonadota bacterium]
MRLLAISSHADTLNSVRPEAELFIGLQQAGVNVTVLTQADSPYAQRMQDAGVTVVNNHIRRKFSLSTVRIIRDSVRERAIDIVYAFNNKAICNAAFASIGLDVLLFAYRGQTGNINRGDPTPYLSILHPRVDGIIGVAEAVVNSLKSVAKNKTLHTVYKGHALEWYDEPAADRQSLGLSDDDFVVGCVANNRPRKGVAYLIEACGELTDLPNLKLMLIGSGMTQTELGTAVAATNLGDRVLMLGRRDDATQLIQACDVSVLPAIRREGLPKTVIEAMAYGIAPIVTDTGGNAELVAHNQSGLVVPVQNAAALADAIRQLHQDVRLRTRLASAARERVHSHFNVEQGVAKTLSIFEDALRKRDT